MTVNGRADPLAGDRIEPGRFGEDEFSISGAGDDRVRQGVLRVALGRRDQANQLALFDDADQNDIGEGRLALGDRARLVEHDGVELVRGFERLG